MEDCKEKKTRTRSGCLNCRRRRRKCDETKPTCLNCAKRNEICDRGVKLSFRKENAQTIEDHGQLEAALPPENDRPRKRVKRFEIVNITGNVVHRYNRSSEPRDLGQTNDTPGESFLDWTSPGSVGLDLPSESVTRTRAARAPSQTLPGNTQTSTQDPHLSQNVSYNEETGPELMSTSTTLLPECPAVLRRPDSVSNQLTLLNSEMTSPTSRNPTQSAAENLLFLRQMQRTPRDRLAPTPFTSASFDMSPPFSYSIDQITPESFLDDGVFLPGSTYQELHATLRQHLINETNSGFQSRQLSPAHGLEVEYGTLRQPAPSRFRAQLDDTEPLNDRTPPLELSKEEEYKLWKNWLNEIAGWLDKFDNQRHFQHSLPIMAQTCDHLKFSMLAVSARQLELKRSSKPTDQSLALYQQAIHLLLPQLHTRSTTVIASCVVLCVLEMLSCSPKAWRRHLDGCANLMQAVGITGFSGGVEQALFWCFARMDVCGGLIDSMKTLIPVDQWASKIDLDADIGLFRASPSFDTYANHAVYLCAQVVVLLSEHRHHQLPLEGRAFADKWMKIWRYVQNWALKRPAEMLPVLTMSAKSMKPFPTILFTNPAAISGNQIFHTSCILLLQDKPASIRLDPKPQPVRWHAHQICGISLSHDHHGAWTNSIQPLWIAGKCMSSADEQSAILGHLRKIESESGWGTRWRMQDLQDYWDTEYG